MTDSPERRHVETRRAYTGRLINVDVDTVQAPDGSTLKLELVRHPGAAAVVPLLSDPAGTDPQVLLIRQYRYAAGGPIWGVPAGVLGAGGAPEGRVRRERVEGTGAWA